MHGLGVSPRHFAPLIHVLERERRVVAPHLPMGRSVGELVALVARAVERPSVLFANSMGCQIAAELAVREPQLVRAVVLVGPTTDVSARTLRQQFVRLVADTLREPPRLTWVVAADYLRNGPVRTLRSARFMVAHRLTEWLPRVEAPAVVVRGEHDPIAPQEWVEQVAGLLPDARLAIIPGAAHCAHFTHPELVAAAEPPLLA